MKQESAKTHFNLIAPFYDKYKRQNRIYYQALKNTVKSLILENKIILDIGCGTGSILSFLNPGKGIGIDISDKMIKLAKHKYKTRHCLKFAVHDIEEKPLMGKFDYILLLDVIEHLKNSNRAFYNISKSMTDKTILIVSMVNPFYEPLLMLMEKLHLKMPEGPHLRISEKQFTAILFIYNLQIIKKVVSLMGLIYVYKIRKT